MKSSGGAKYRIADSQGNIIQDNCTIEMVTEVIQEGTPVNKVLFDDIGFHYGMILLWSGSVSNIPSGWHLCDGTNGTPDLRNRFIVGAGSGYTVGASGGSNSVVLNVNQLPSHTHTGETATNGQHNHTLWYSNVGTDRGYDALIANGISRVSRRGDEYTRVYTDSFNTKSEMGQHSHSITIANTGAGGGHENRPPYYALAYIMKI